jgi:hydroxymethylglutaryl-CoA reductase
MVEQAVGMTTVPLGVATGFVIDGREQSVPLATEEPSVIAAATFAAYLVAEAGGFTTWAADPLMCAHIYIEGVSDAGLEALARMEPEARRTLEPLLAGMVERGGGLRGVSVCRVVGTDLARLELRIDVRDALGANLLDSAAESLRAQVERAGGGRVLMGILSNTARERRAGASFRLPAGLLGPACPAGMDGGELARRIVVASGLAQVDPERAVTHNKGIMNGISALALATGNDTRALEAAAHAYAAQAGTYRGLSRYSLSEDNGEPHLLGEIDLPLPLGTVGGSVGFTPASSLVLKILGEPTGEGLARIAAAVGLAQNLAALAALCGRGIQNGHLRLHARRLAWRAGARGAETAPATERIAALLRLRGSLPEAEMRAIVLEVRARSPAEGAR